MLVILSNAIGYLPNNIPSYLIFPARTLTYPGFCPKFYAMDTLH